MFIPHCGIILVDSQQSLLLKGVFFSLTPETFLIRVGPIPYKTSIIKLMLGINARAFPYK